MQTPLDSPLSETSTLPLGEASQSFPSPPSPASSQTPPPMTPPSPPAQASSPCSTLHCMSTLANSIWPPPSSTQTVPSVSEAFSPVAQASVACQRAAHPLRIQAPTILPMAVTWTSQAARTR